jgi:signal transduction histidine kinase
MDRKRFLLALAALAAGLAVAWLMLTNDARRATATDVFLTLGIGWSFVASGLVAWQLRPSNAIGPVMIATGFLRFAAALDWSQDPLFFSIGLSLEPAYLVGLAYVLLAFPGGRLVSLVERLLFGVFVAAGGPLHVAWLMFEVHDRHVLCADCSGYVFGVVEAEPVARVFEVTHEVIGVLAGVLVLGVLIDRWRRASAPLRFAIAPILWAGAAAVVAILFWMITALVEAPLAGAPQKTMEFMLGVVAVAFLVGVARTRLAHSAVADLVVEMGEVSAPAVLRDSLARTLRDPSLEVAYWLEDADRYVDARGRLVVLPVEDETRAVTMIEREGRRIAALVHDPALREDEHLVESVCAAAALELDNERLQAELRARLEEVEASRARIVEAAMTERRRIERDLHDGAQQRLVSVAMSLGLAESKVATEPEAAVTFVREAKGRLADALVELRDLSQGIHPGILTERGLCAALAELAQRVDMRVVLDVSVSERLPERVEEAGYYVVSEALTNVVKHAQATHARVQVDHLDGVAVMRVSDDGTGGADSTRGSGLRGLRDRVEALGGRLTVASPRGGGTLLEAQIPCVS